MDIDEELKNTKYKNWVQGAKGVIYLQEGLEKFVGDHVAKHRDQIVQKITSALPHGSLTHCNLCTLENLLPEHAASGQCSETTCIQNQYSSCFGSKRVGRRTCPRGICGKIYDEIVRTHKYRNPMWQNTDPSTWCSDPLGWSYAKCFQTTPNPYTSSSDTDAHGLLSIIINSKLFQNEVSCSLDSYPNVFHSARCIRNEMLYRAKMELEENELQSYLAIFIAVLTDEKKLLHNLEATQAVEKLEKLKNKQIKISLSDEINLLQVRKEALTALEKLEKKDKDILENLKKMKHDSVAEIEGAKSEMQVIRQEALEEIEEAKPDMRIRKEVTLNKLQEAQTEALNYKSYLLEAVRKSEAAITQLISKQQQMKKKSMIEVERSTGNRQFQNSNVSGRGKEKIYEDAELGQAKTATDEAKSELVMNMSLCKIIDATEHRCLFEDVQREDLQEAGNTPEKNIQIFEIVKQEDKLDKKEENILENLEKMKPNLLVEIKDAKSEMQVIMREALEETEEAKSDMHFRKEAALNKFQEASTEALNYKSYLLEAVQKPEAAITQLISEKQQMKKKSMIEVERSTGNTQFQNSNVSERGEGNIYDDAELGQAKTATDKAKIELVKNMRLCKIIDVTEHRCLFEDVQAKDLQEAGNTPEKNTQIFEIAKQEDEINRKVFCQWLDKSLRNKIQMKFGSTKLTIFSKDRTVLTGQDLSLLAKWLRMSSVLLPYDFLSFKKITTENKAEGITLDPNLNIDTVVLFDCCSDFVVKGKVKTVILGGRSILAIGNYLSSNTIFDKLCLDFWHNPKEKAMYCMLNESIIEYILLSVDTCPFLKYVELRNVTIGCHKNIICCLKRSAIKAVKDDKNIKTMRTTCSALLGPFLSHVDLNYRDFNSEKSNLIKAIILDAISHKIVTEYNEILEAYACEDRRDNTSRITIACYLKSEPDPCSKLPKEYAGFPVSFKSYYSVSSESIKAEAAVSSTKDVHYNYRLFQDMVSGAISNNVDIMFTNHSNLEAVCGSLVKAKKCGIDKNVPCIVLYCRWKGMIPYGEKTFPKFLFDENNQAVSTDIREGFFMFGPNDRTLTAEATTWNQELAMGCSIGPRGGKLSATLGPFLNICGTNETCFLSVRHMFHPSDEDDSKLRGTKIVQPADGVAMVSASGYCSSKSVEERICGTLLLACFCEKADASVVKIDQGRIPNRGNFVNVTKEALEFAGFSVSSFPIFDQGNMLDATESDVSDYATERIIKFGYKTGLTKGSLDLKEMAVRVKDEEKLSIRYNGMVYGKVMKNQLKINSYAGKPFFLEGDSGSAVFLVDKSNKLFCIGMAIGYLPDLSCVVTPIQQILDTLNSRAPEGVKFELKTFEFEEMDSRTT